MNHLYINCASARQKPAAVFQTSSEMVSMEFPKTASKMILMMIRQTISVAERSVFSYNTVPKHSGWTHPCDTLLYAAERAAEIIFCGLQLHIVQRTEQTSHEDVKSISDINA